MVKRLLDEQSDKKPSIYWQPWLVAFIFLPTLIYGMINGFVAPNELVLDQPLVLGEEVEKELVEKVVYSHPVAVMIDNHFATWESQFGLSKAPVVYHTLVEGGATRFMAVFNVHDEIEQIGPVRSVRPYYIPWALEYDALLAHVGGSAQALQDITRLAVYDLDEMGIGQYYYTRDEQFDAPHNTFTGSAQLQDGLGVYDLDALQLETFVPFNFGEQIVVAKGAARHITIDYSARRTYDVEYVWQEDVEVYHRYRVDEVQFDAATDEAIGVANIIIQHVPQEEILDADLRIAMDVLGTGEAQYFINGQEFAGTWEKATLQDATQFFDQAGNEMIFAHGNVWIEIVPDGHDVVTSVLGYRF